MEYIADNVHNLLTAMMLTVNMITLFNDLNALYDVFD